MGVHVCAQVFKKLSQSNLIIPSDFKIRLHNYTFELHRKMGETHFIVQIGEDSIYKIRSDRKI